MPVHDRRRRSRLSYLFPRVSAARRRPPASRADAARTRSPSPCRTASTTPGRTSGAYVNFGAKTRCRYHGLPGSPSGSSSARSARISCWSRASSVVVFRVDSARSLRASTSSPASRSSRAAARASAEIRGRAPRFLRLVHEFFDSPSVRLVVERQDIGIRQPQRASGPRSAPARRDSGIPDRRCARPSCGCRRSSGRRRTDREREVRDRHAEKIQEHGVVGSAAEAIVDQLPARAARQRVGREPCRGRRRQSGYRAAGSLTVWATSLNQAVERRHRRSR